MAPQLWQVFVPEVIVAEHLGQEVWLKLTGCMMDLVLNLLIDDASIWRLKGV